MKLLLILSLLCINNVAPPETDGKNDQGKVRQVQQKPQPKQKPVADKAPGRKAAKTPMPFYPSPLLVDLF